MKKTYSSQGKWAIMLTLVGPEHGTAFLKCNLTAFHFQMRSPLSGTPDQVFEHSGQDH